MLLKLKKYRKSNHGVFIIYIVAVIVLTSVTSISASEKSFELNGSVIYYAEVVELDGNEYTLRDVYVSSTGFVFQIRENKRNEPTVTLEFNKIKSINFIGDKDSLLTNYKLAKIVLVNGQERNAYIRLRLSKDAYVSISGVDTILESTIKLPLAKIKQISFLHNGTSKSCPIDKFKFYNSALEKCPFDNAVLLNSE